MQYLNVWILYFGSKYNVLLEWLAVEGRHKERGAGEVKCKRWQALGRQDQVRGLVAGWIYVVALEGNQKAGQMSVDNLERTGKRNTTQLELPQR